VSAAPGRPPDPARVFVALALGAELGALAGAAVERALASGTCAWRRARPDGLHLTLFFLGATARPRLAELAAELAPALAPLPAPELRLRGTGVFPDTRRPRVLWLGVAEAGAGGRLAAARAAVLAALARAGVDTAAEAARPFTPHVTVARPERRPRSAGGDGGNRRARVPDAFRALDLDVEWTPREAVLLESLGGPDGSRYEPVARFPFSAGPA
jgi:2'-5' RNA ligase